MSIIEKALDKLDDKRPLPKLDPLPPEAPGKSVKPAQPVPLPAVDPAPPSHPDQRREAKQPHHDSLPPEEAVSPPAKVAKAPRTEPKKPPRRQSNEAVIDLRRLRDLGLLTPQDAHTRLAEENRLLKRPLIRNAAGKGATPLRFANLILVTSSVPNEGKTFVSINLAMSIAMEMDRTVLLVDADVVKSDVCSMLGIPAMEGLTDVLASDHLDIADVIVKTNIPKFSVIPAGRNYPNVTELFSSDQMSAITEEFSTRYDDRIVIFDSAPLLATSITSGLTGHVGQVVLVIEAERTAQSTVKEALDTLTDAQSVAAILNKSRERNTVNHYGYGYGY